MCSRLTFVALDGGISLVTSDAAAHCPMAYHLALRVDAALVTGVLTPPLRTYLVVATVGVFETLGR